MASEELPRVKRGGPLLLMEEERETRMGDRAWAVVEEDLKAAAVARE